jgi:hypothetical protein
MNAVDSMRDIPTRAKGIVVMRRHRNLGNGVGPSHAASVKEAPPDDRPRAFLSARGHKGRLRGGIAA